jgi:hypothetical protein
VQIEELEGRSLLTSFCYDHAPLAEQYYEMAVEQAQSDPAPTFTDRDQIINALRAHESPGGRNILYVYPDSRQVATIGIGIAVKSNPTEIDQVFGRGTAAKMLKDFKKAKAAWDALPGNAKFKYDPRKTSAYAKFVKKHPEFFRRYDNSKLNDLFKAIVPKYEQIARDALGTDDTGADVYDNLPWNVKSTILELAYNRGNLLKSMTPFIEHIRAGQYACAGWDVMDIETTDGKVWAQIVKGRSIDLFRALVAGQEGELVSFEAPPPPPPQYLACYFDSSSPDVNQWYWRCHLTTSPSNPGFITSPWPSDVCDDPNTICEL